MNIRSIFSLLTATAVVTLCGACHSDHHGHDHGAEGHDHAAEVAAAHGDHDDAHGADEIIFTVSQAKEAGLQVTAVRPDDFHETIEVSGRILPAQGAEATVTATMAGLVKLTAAGLAEGTPVKAGQGLFFINGRPMADGNPAAVANVELNAARQALDRAEKLAAERIISADELEAARARYAAADAMVKSLGSAQNSRSAAAPISGYVKNILVKNGDYVSAGQPLATITESGRVQLRADVPERYYSMLPRIVSANFRMAYDKGDKVYSLADLGGRLLSKGKAAADDFFVPVTFEFNNRGEIVSGSFAEVYLLGEKRSGVLAVPTEAIVEMQGLYYVYVQIGKEAYLRREVKIGLTDGRRTEIVSGLKPGEKVVTRGAVQVRLAANATVIPEGHSH